MFAWKVEEISRLVYTYISDSCCLCVIWYQLADENLSIIITDCIKHTSDSFVFRHCI